jgi:retinol-binding protein 3
MMIRFMADRRRRAIGILCGFAVLAALVPAAFCQTGSNPAGRAALPDLNSSARAEVAEKFAQVLADEYAYADKGAKIAETIRAKLKSGAYDRIAVPSEFAEALQADARLVADDRHLWVAFTPGGAPTRVMRRGGPPSPEMLEQMRKQNAAIPEVRILDGNIGYLPVNGMLPAQVANDAIAAAFAFLHNTDALIIDLRANPGGSGYAEVYLSYLSEGPPYVTGTVHWRKDNRVQEFKTTDMGRASYGAKKPVFVLTSRSTFSAAEGLAYAIQAFKRGTIVGETTGGGANPSAGGGGVQLGHGFVANVPTGYVVNATTGTNWEGVGVKPDVPVPPEQALGKAWSLAADKLRQQTTDRTMKDVLEAISLAKLDGAPSLTPAQIAGAYLPVSGQTAPDGAPVRIFEKGGALNQRRSFVLSGVRETRDVPLVPAGGDRFAPQGAPYGSSSLTFFVEDGTVRCLQIDRMGPSIRERSQAAR